MLLLSLGALLCTAALTWTGLRWRRTKRASDPTAGLAVAGYGRLLALLARHGGLRPRVGQTPREFAGAARRFLARFPAVQELLGLPDEIVDRLYGVRFGGRLLDEMEIASTSARLDRLAAALKRNLD